MRLRALATLSVAEMLILVGILNFSFEFRESSSIKSRL